ncbi:TetR/AcrR family transcriptional regulator [Amycolatopsis pigmentata]|uniref:TetR/AcrR family transcriptional regulator n=1 Tax=Amycolatopsis pigmentata TaxID=450801 RepID=A0ABW5FLG4_9PSEU
MTGPDPEDLTARARIRDAALWHFGEHGFDRATIRGIAETAGVSSGLVRHHFGSKEALRDACDAYLVRALERINDQVRADGADDGVNYVAVTGAVFGPHQKYIARALSEGRAAPLFDKLVELGQQWLAEVDEKRSDRPDLPLKDRAVVGAAMTLSIAVLHHHVSRGLGVDVLSPGGAEVLAPILLDLYSHPYLSPREAAEFRSRLGKDGNKD